MGQQATAEAVRYWTLNPRDPAACLTNKAALLEREASFSTHSYLNKTNLDPQNQERANRGRTEHPKVCFLLFSVLYVYVSLFFIKCVTEII